MKTLLIRLGVAFAWLAVFGQCAFADVTFSVTPSAVSNTYTGTITLQISGLTNRTVIVQKYLDLNTNGMIDGGDWLVQQFTLQDGTNFVIDGVTNFNVPGDLNATTGAITATLNFQNGDFVQNIAGSYLFRLSNPGGHFEPITNRFAVTNFPFPQTLTGSVVSNGTSTTLPNAIVLLFPPPQPGDNGPSGSPLAGTVADNAGNYNVQAPPGSYMPVAFENDYVADMSMAPVLTLAASQTITTNLTLISATTSISGSVVDANNAGIGLPGVMVPAMSDDGLLTITFTGTNGNFNVPVADGNWKIEVDDTTLIVHGYLGLNDGTNVTAGATGVTPAVPAATALIYGSVKDILGNPLVGLDVYANEQNNLYETDAYTDANGNYVIGVLGLGEGDSWWIQANGNNQLTNYVFSQETINGNINAGQAVLQNFTAILGTNHITGSVKDSSNNPIAGVGVSANATINGTNYQTSVDTDANGNYSMSVANGTWSISINCNGGDDSLDNILGSGNYQCPDSQTATINNNDATNNFIVQPCDGIQIFTTNFPAGEVNVYYNQFLLVSSCNGPLTGSLISGSLPPGLTANTSSGQIYGTPTNAGTFTFTVQLSDGVNTTNKQFSISISNAVQITTTSLPDGTNGSAYSQQLQAAEGVSFDGASPYSWTVSSGNLPAGLTLATNGLLSGTLADSGTFDFTVEVTDSVGGIYDQSLSLTIAAGAPVPDVLTYYVTKLEAFQQLDANNLVPNTNVGPYIALVGIVQSSLGVVPIATVTLPTGAVVGLPWGSSGIEIRSQESFSSQASFDAAYPPGNYDFAIYGLDDGLQFPVLSLPAPVYPNPPQVSNFAAAQSLNPLADFTLQWNAIPGATTGDALWVVITDATGNPVFSTPYPATNWNGSLTGTATSVVIPTNTFQFGHAYTGTITFFKITSVNTTDYPGATGITVVAVQTWFSLIPASAAPAISHPARLSGTQFGFQLSGIQGQNYTVLTSTNLSLPVSDWSPMLMTNLSSSTVFIQDNQATNKQRFYRVLFGP